MVFSRLYRLLPGGNERGRGIRMRLVTFQNIPLHRLWRTATDEGCLGQAGRNGSDGWGCENFLLYLFSVGWTCTDHDEAELLRIRMT